SQSLGAEKGEIGRARVFHREEERLGCDKQCHDSDAGRNGPNRLPAGDSERREHAARTSSDERVANRDGGIGSGRDDDNDRDAEERQETVHENRPACWRRAANANRQSPPPWWSERPTLY